MEQITANYPGDIEELEKILQAHGATLDDFRSQIADNLTLKNYRDIAFLVEARIPEEQAIAFYEQNLERLTHDDQVRALQIMIPLPFATSADDAEVAAQKKAQARAKAEMALKEAQEGLDFNELIDRYMDPTTKMATNDGQLFWVTRGSSGFPEMEEVLFSLEPGEVGGLIESEFSFHIVKVLEKKPAGVTPYEQVRWEIMEFLTDNSINIALDKRLKQLRSEAQIEIIDPELKAAWADFQAKIYAPPAPADLNENSDEFQDSSDHESEIVSESEAASASEAVSESEVVEEQSAGSDTPSQETVGEPAP
jgi:peptidyl-prolyl cis-trans isomerase C